MAGRSPNRHRALCLVLAVGLFTHCSVGNSNEDSSQRTSATSAPAAPVLGWTPAYASAGVAPPVPVLPIGPLGNVLDFGARCDGTTDDREAIQRGLETVVVLIFPAGATCVVNAGGSVRFLNTSHRYALSIPSNRVLYLNGSILKLGDAQNAHLFINTNLVGAGDHDIAILGPGTIDLNKAHQTSPVSGEQSGGLMDQVTDLTLRDITFMHVREYALRHFRVQRGYYDNLICTDSDGSCFAFGVSGVGGPNNSYFGHIEGHHALGIASPGAQGNPFIAHGSNNLLDSFVGTGNRFGFKLQDGATDWTIGRIQVTGTTADKGVKIMGVHNGAQTRRVTIGDIVTQGNYYEGLYVWESDDIEIRRLVSKGDAAGAASTALLLAPTANRIAMKSIAVQESGGGGASIEAGDVEIGDMYVRNNGKQLGGQDNVAIQSTAQRIRIRSLITVDDQQSPTVAYGLRIRNGASDVDVQAFLPLGSFTASQYLNAAVTVRVVDSHAIAQVFPDGATAPSVLQGTLFKTANSGTTPIAGFTGGVANQEISVLCGDLATFFVDTPTLRLTSPMACTNGNLIRFIFDGGTWVETGRTVM